MPFSRADYEDYYICTHALQQLQEMFLHNITLSDEEIELLKWLTSIKPQSLVHGKTVLQIPDRLTYDFMKGLDSPGAS